MQLLEDQTLTLTPCTSRAASGPGHLEWKPDSAAPPLTQHLSWPLDASHQVERGPDPALAQLQGHPLASVGLSPRGQFWASPPGSGVAGEGSAGQPGPFIS